MILLLYFLGVFFVCLILRVFFVCLFLVLALTFRSVIHSELVFGYNVKKSSKSILWYVNIQLLRTMC